MLKFITNLFGTKKAEPVAPYKVETPAFPVQETPVVNPVSSVVNGRKAPAAKPKTPTATGNTPAKSPAKKKVSSGANKKSQTKTENLLCSRTKKLAVFDLTVPV